MNDPAPTAFLTPAQKQWLLMTGIAVVFALLGKYGLSVTPVPFPAGLDVQVERIAADVKRIDANVQATATAVDRVQGLQLLSNKPKE